MAGETVAYWILSSLVVLAAAVSTAHGDWVSDSWIHLGAIHEMSRDFWSPVEPLVGEDVPFPYFSPWTAVGALGVRLFSVTPFQVLAVFAVVSPLVLVHSLHRLVRAVSPAPWAPVAVLAALLTVWGTRAFFWSGFLSLNTLVVGSSWPSVLATAFWFYLWAAVWTSTRMTRGLIATLLVVPGVLLLFHPFTFLSAATACAITVLLRWPRQRWLSGAVPSLISVGLAALWPWISLGDLLDNPRGFDGFHVFFYDDVMAKFGLLLLTIPAIVLRLGRQRTDPLGWSVLAGVGIWAAGGVLHVESLGRVIPLASTAAAVALAVAAAEALQPADAGSTGTARPRGASAARSVVVLAWVVAVAVGSMTQSNAWSRITVDDAARRNPDDGTHLISPYPVVTDLWASIPSGSVVVARDPRVARQLPASGLFSVAPQWPSPGVTDTPRRVDDEAAILSAKTSPELREELLTRYDVGWIVWPDAKKTPTWLAELGVPLDSVAGQTLYDVR